MAVIRVNKTKDYTVISNYHLKDKRLSLKAKGLLSLMLSLPNDWDYSISGLVAISKEKDTSIKSTLDELRRYGYLTISKQFPDETKSGRIEYEYNIYEKPKKFQDVEKQGVEILPLEIQGVENQGQLNTNKLNTNKLNTNKKRRTDYDSILGRIKDESLKEIYYEFVKMRDLIKAPMTAKALEMLVNKVGRLEPDDVERQKKLLENAILNNWKSVYPLNDNKSINSRSFRGSQKILSEEEANEIYEV